MDFKPQIFAITRGNAKALSIMNTMYEPGTFQVIESLAPDQEIPDGSILFEFAFGIKIDREDFLHDPRREFLPNYAHVLLNDGYARGFTMDNANLHFIGFSPAYQPEIIVNHLVKPNLDNWIKPFVPKEKVLINA